MQVHAVETVPVDDEQAIPVRLESHVGGVVELAVPSRDRRHVAEPVDLSDQVVVPVGDVDVSPVAHGEALRRVERGVGSRTVVGSRPGTPAAPSREALDSHADPGRLLRLGIALDPFRRDPADAVVGRVGHE